jgi:hypothetical protein
MKSLDLISIKKIPLDNPFLLGGVKPDFEEFDDLLLLSIENKKKLKNRKRNEDFNYKLFHERIRAIAQQDINEIITMSSPPPVPVRPVSKSRKALSNHNHNSSSCGKSDNNNNNNRSSEASSSSSYSPPSRPRKPIPSVVLSLPEAVNIHSDEDEDDNNNNNNNDNNDNNDHGDKYSSQRNCVDEEEEESGKSLRNTKIKTSSLNTVKNANPHESVQSYFSDDDDNNNNDDDNNKNTGVVKTIRSHHFKVTSRGLRNSLPKVSSFNSSIGILSACNESPLGSHNNNNNINNSMKRRSSAHKVYVNSFRSDVVVKSITARSVTSDISDDDEKRELLFKFQILSTKNPTLVSKFPFTMRSDVKVMKSTYAMILKQISVNSKVDNLNTYMLAGFMMCEYVFGKLGFDMEGFSKHQIASRKSYESLLTELGEKEYTPYGMDKWSVEVRLMATLVFNAFWFIVAKSISKKTNFDIMGLISS